MKFLIVGRRFIGKAVLFTLMKVTCTLCAGYSNIIVSVTHS
jgi:hypothetical protein